MQIFFIRQRRKKTLNLPSYIQTGSFLHPPQKPNDKRMYTWIAPTRLKHEFTALKRRLPKPSCELNRYNFKNLT